VCADRRARIKSTSRKERQRAEEEEIQKGTQQFPKPANPDGLRDRLRKNKNVGGAGGGSTVRDPPETQLIVLTATEMPHLLLPLLQLLRVLHPLPLRLY
jgi:hypothetical protein